MKLSSAYELLEIPETSSEEEVKKKYRELTKKYHPDINKDPNAEDRFKKINEAYDTIKNKDSIEELDVTNHNESFFMVKNVFTNLNISFKESVLGCTKSISIDRNLRCNSCNGMGRAISDNGCKVCHGTRTVTERKDNFIFTRNCTSCDGNVKFIKCKSCSNGVVSTKSNIEVHVPPGIYNNSTLRLAGMGNYAGSVFNIHQRYTDVLIRVSVTPEPGLSLDGNNVYSSLNISLLEALKGCTKKVKTINGEMNINIHSLSKNKDEIIIPKQGVPNIGNHVVVLSVEYPKDVSNIIDLLNKEV